MLYPVYNNGPFIVIPLNILNSNLKGEWTELQTDEINLLLGDLEFSLISNPKMPYLCLIDIRKGNNVFIMDSYEIFYVHKSIKRPLKFKSEVSELIFFQESIESIRLKSKDYVKNTLYESLFHLLNEKLEQSCITLQVHKNILSDYKNTLNNYVIS